MRLNEGKTDRIIRLALGSVLAVVSAFLLEGTPQIILAVFALIMLITALTGYCGIYAILGISTCPVKK